MNSKIIRGGPGTPAPEGALPIRNLMQSPQEQMSRLFAEAHHAGFKTGREAGLKDFVTATSEAVAAVRGEFFALDAMLAPLVLQAVQKIIGALPQDEVARRAIGEALTEAGSGIAATLRVAPDDLEISRKVVRDLAQARPDLATAITAVEPDAGLRKGEMLLETLRGRTHIGIEYQLARLGCAVTGAPAGGQG